MARPRRPPRFARRRHAAGAATALLVLAFSPPAAAQARTWHAGGSVGFSSLFGGPSAAGFGTGVHAAYGVSDFFNVLGTFDVTAHPYARWVILSGGLGATYLVDVARWIPYAGAVAGPAGIVSVNPSCGISIAEPCRAFRLNLAIPFGVDWRATPHLTLGAGGRVQVLLLGDVPWLTANVTAKVEYTWGR